jgi:hypothetical protein
MRNISRAEACSRKALDSDESKELREERREERPQRQARVPVEIMIDSMPAWERAIRPWPAKIGLLSSADKLNDD